MVVTFHPSRLPQYAMNEELKPYIGKDFDMDVVEEGETLRVTLTHDKRAKPKKNPKGISCKPSGSEV